MPTRKRRVAVNERAPRVTWTSTVSSPGWVAVSVAAGRSLRPAMSARPSPQATVNQRTITPSGSGGATSRASVWPTSRSKPFSGVALPPGPRAISTVALERTEAYTFASSPWWRTKVNPARWARAASSPGRRFGCAMTSARATARRSVAAGSKPACTRSLPATPWFCSRSRRARSACRVATRSLLGSAAEPPGGAGKSARGSPSASSAGSNPSSSPRVPLASASATPRRPRSSIDSSGSSSTGRIANARLPSASVLSASSTTSGSATPCTVPATSLRAAWRLAGVGRVQRRKIRSRRR